MFTEETLRTRLPIGGLGLPLHFFESVGSTNDVALDLAQGGAPHGTLVVADTQTRGRGRGERRSAADRRALLAVVRHHEQLARERLEYYLMYLLLAYRRLILIVGLFLLVYVIAAMFTNPLAGYTVLLPARSPRAGAWRW